MVEVHALRFESTKSIRSFGRNEVRWAVECSDGRWPALRVTKRNELQAYTQRAETVEVNDLDFESTKSDQWLCHGILLVSFWPYRSWDFI